MSVHSNKVCLMLSIFRFLSQISKLLSALSQHSKHTSSDRWSLNYFVVFNNQWNLYFVSSTTRFETRHLSGKLDKFLHEELKIVGCKIKRYFKMCLPVFIGSIKASFGSAFWPLRSGGHFYKAFQSMKTSREDQKWIWIRCRAQKTINRLFSI